MGFEIKRDYNRFVLLRKVSIFLETPEGKTDRTYMYGFGGLLFKIRLILRGWFMLRRIKKMEAAEKSLNKLLEKS